MLVDSGTDTGGGGGGGGVDRVASHPLSSPKRLIALINIQTTHHCRHQNDNLIVKSTLNLV